MSNSSDFMEIPKHLFYEMKAELEDMKSKLVELVSLSNEEKLSLANGVYMSYL